MKKSSKLVFFGTEDFSAPSLQKLLEGSWSIVAAVTKPDSRGGRGQKPIVPKVKQITEQHNIPVLQPTKVAEINKQLAALKPDFGVLVAYGKIIPQSTIDLFPGGIINVHPSLLPAWRGASPIEAAILANEPETGISLMRLSAGMDEGPVYSQQRIPLNGSEDRIELYKNLAQKGADFLVENLDSITQGWLMPKPQNDRLATYSQLLKKDDGAVDFNKPAEQIEREVRAYAGWPKSRAKINGFEVIITKARVAAGENDGQLVMKCRPGYLEILQLKPSSGRTMSGADFLRGYKKLKLN